MRQFSHSTCIMSQTFVLHPEILPSGKIDSNAKTHTHSPQQEGAGDEWWEWIVKHDARTLLLAVTLRQREGERRRRRRCRGIWLISLNPSPFFFFLLFHPFAIPLLSSSFLILPLSPFISCFVSFCPFSSTYSLPSSSHTNSSLHISPYLLSFSPLFPNLSSSSFLLYASTHSPLTIRAKESANWLCLQFHP